MAELRIFESNLSSSDNVIKSIEHLIVDFEQ